MSYGYTGKILRIDLTTNEISIDEHDEIWYRTYMGGGCVAAYYMLKEMEPGIDPLSEDNMLIFSLSPVVGTPVAGFSRMNVAGKSPLTGAFGESQAGGFWGPELKKAGWDGIVIKGKSKLPVYINIMDNKVEIKDANSIWGKDIGETEEIIRNELEDNNIRIASIGQAGENLVRYACIINNLKHACGRNGLGAVMGSKNLKAISVRGHGKFNMKNPEIVNSKAKWFVENFRDNINGLELNEFGTSVWFAGTNNHGMLPTNNFRNGAFDEYENLSAESYRESILVKGEGCYACAVKCKRVVTAEEPYKVDSKFGGPEYETIAAFGSNCGVDNLVAVAKAHELCNKYGMDTISAGVTVAFAMELYEKGIINKENTDGIDLSWGNHKSMLELVTKIAFRQGFGDLLAEGSMRAAETIGNDAYKYSMNVKGQEFALHEPRGKGMVAVGYAVSEIGACHLKVEHDVDFDFHAPEPYLEQAKVLGILKRLPSETMDEEKIRNYYHLQQHFSFLDVLGGCIFTFAPVRAITMTDLIIIINAVTGWETSLWEIMKLGERRWNMARVFNIREGFTAEDDWLPGRMFEKLENGVLKGRSIGKEELQKAIKLYYEMCNWNSETAIPNKAKLIELDLKWISDEMDNWVKIGQELRIKGNVPVAGKKY